MTRELIDLFESKVYYSLDGCHYWTTCLDPKGMQVMHSCDNPPCVNPHHLSVGTNADNVRDKVSKNRQYKPKGEKHPQAKLCEKDVLAIRKSRGVITGRKLATQFGISEEYVYEIWTRQSWKHI